MATIELANEKFEEVLRANDTVFLLGIVVWPL